MMTLSRACSAHGNPGPGRRKQPAGNAASFDPLGSQWPLVPAGNLGRGQGSRAGTRVQVRTGHVVTFDTRTTAAIRSIHVAGLLRFDPDRDTRLDVGLIKIQAGDDPGESGFDCEAHVMAPAPGPAPPRLEVGTPDQPVRRAHRP